MHISDAKIIQIVGYKNTGKTTLSETLISYIKNEGKDVGTIKHHGHGGEPDMDPRTDSSRHLRAGSMITTVKGEKETHITLREKDALSIHKLLDVYNQLSVDFILIEGYKNLHFPKILLIKTVDELFLLEKLTNIIAVGVMDKRVLKKLNHTSFFVFPLVETVKYLPQLMECITVNTDKGS